jgi:hypothetical protein
LARHTAETGGQGVGRIEGRDQDREAGLVIHDRPC